MTITLVGFGLLASSIAAALRQATTDFQIHAVSSPATGAQAVELGLADQAFTYAAIAEWLPASDLVLLCTPVANILEQINHISQHSHLVSKKLVVSDIGSTKLDICTAGFALPAPLQFVGGHPMAGSEKRGMEHGAADIFENAYWILCPPDNTAQYEVLERVIDITGAHRVVLPAAEHDHIMARLSHTPQLLSTALAASIPAWVMENDYQHLAGRGFRDMTRLAASPWQMWKDIIYSNTAEITASLFEVKAVVEQLLHHLQATPPHPADIAKIFAQGAATRASLSNPGKGFSHSLYEVMVHIADHKGALLSVISPLVDAGINVLDIELAKVREGVGGTLLLGFKTVEDATACVEILGRKQLKAKLRL
jgi:prephenate dehydrogenase